MQEANRQFFHPLGLALTVRVCDDGNTELAFIQDSRDDLEGFCFSEIDSGMVSKGMFVMSEQRLRSGLRVRLFGSSIQPLKKEHFMIEELTDLDKRNIIDAVSQQIHFHAITIKGVLEWVRLSGKAGDAGIHARHLPKIIEACSKNRELKEEILAIRADNEKMKDELCRLYQERDWDKGTMWSAGNE